MPLITAAVRGDLRAAMQAEIRFNLDGLAGLARDLTAKREALAA